MSNLGSYQWITRTSKKVGGPINLLLLTGVAGAAIYKLGEMGVKKCYSAIKIHRAAKVKCCAIDEKIYLFTSSGTSDEGVRFSAGDQFRILQKDGETVLIEILDDNNKPCLVSAEYLRNISNFEK